MLHSFIQTLQYEKEQNVMLAAAESLEKVIIYVSVAELDTVIQTITTLQRVEGRAPFAPYIQLKLNNILFKLSHRSH